jgi:hypothetical protein
MAVALLEIDLQFFDAGSLKDKRSILARLRSAVRRDFNVSFAEMDHQDLWQRSRVGMAFIAPGRGAAEAEARALLKFLEKRFDGQVTGHHLEIY